jgi:hypothetical protein
VACPVKLIRAPLQSNVYRRLGSPYRARLALVGRSHLARAQTENKQTTTPSGVPVTITS